MSVANTGISSLSQSFDSTTLITNAEAEQNTSPVEIWDSDSVGGIEPNSVYVLNLSCQLPSYASGYSAFLVEKVSSLGARTTIAQQNADFVVGDFTVSFSYVLNPQVDGVVRYAVSIEVVGTLPLSEFPTLTQLIKIGTL